MAHRGWIKKGGKQFPPLSDSVLTLIAGLPLIALIIAALVAFGDGNSALSARMLPVALRDTAWLMGMVGVGTAVLGLFFAWLVTHFEFPGRRWFDWLLVLPLAIPTYLSAYAWVEFLDFTGPAQEIIRAITGAQSIREYWFPEIRTTGGAAFVMMLVLYPYVYLSCRAFFLMQSGSVSSAARVLGATRWRTFISVTLPLSRPAIIVGVTLALMEVVNDLGAVQYFGVNSLTAVIYATWLNRGSFGGAAQLAISIVLIIGLLIWLEQRARCQRAYLSRRDSHAAAVREPLSPGNAALAFAACLLVIGLGFGVPLGELLALSSKKIAQGAIPSGLLSALSNTVLLASAGAALCLLLGYYTSWRSSDERNAASKGLMRIATLGYAVPGTVLALGLVAPLGAADGLLNTITKTLFDWKPGLILSGSFFALLYAYSVRFVALSHNTLDTARRRRGTSVLDAGQVLGVRGWRLIWKIDLPTLTPALLSAATLVFVECVKELPATLLLRPLGVETLATLVYQQASAELFDSAAIPALGIVLAGLVPVVWATRLSTRQHGSTS